MAAKKRPFNHPRRSSSGFKWWHVIAIALVLAAALFLLERLKRSYQEETTVRPQPLATLPPPTTPLPDYSHKKYSSGRAALPQKPVRQYPVAAKGTVSVIVDDMGSSLQEANQLLAIHIPLTFSIIPGLAKAKAVAATATAAGLQVMVHLPMEPQGYPKQRLEGNGLLVSYSAEEITARTTALLGAIPGAVGANNHMGSRFTEQEEKMLPVLQVLKRKGLFFVDSRTSPKSTGFALAGRLGIKTATRNIFLDNEQDVTAIKKQLFAAAAMAGSKGGVIAICHPHPATIQALKESLPALQNSGVRFVFAGDLVR